MSQQLLNEFQEKIAQESSCDATSLINTDLIGYAQQVADLACLENHDNAQYVLHTVLNNLLKIDYYLPTGKNDKGCDRSPTLFTIKQIFITAFLKNLESRIDKDSLYKRGSFRSWWDSTLSDLKACPHDLFSYLSEKGTAGELEEFIRQDASVHVPFDDSLALMQVGTRGKIKEEFFDNFSDEIGHGEEGESEDHLSMFNRMIETLSIDTHDMDTVSWQAKACANFLMIVSIYRSLHYVGIGYMGCVEYLTPGRFSHIVKAGRRLGYPDSTMNFYIQHSECDIKHSEGWLHHVILPAVEHMPESAGQIAKGLMYRLTVSDLFWSNIYSSFTVSPRVKQA